MYGSNERKQEITLLHISLNYMTTKDMKRQEITEQLTRALHADDPRLLAYMTALVKAVHLITE